MQIELILSESEKGNWFMRYVKANLALAFELKSSFYTLATMHILTDVIDDIVKGLQEQKVEAPKFFCNSPIVVDISKIISDIDSDKLHSILHCIKQYDYVPIAIRESCSKVSQLVKGFEIALLRGMQKQRAAENIKLPQTSAKFISEPVRSGQQIYAPYGDLIVMAPVGCGAEVAAAGNIHIYSSLRGRAFAGVNSNQNAMISCRKLEAELVCISGKFLISENISEENWSHPAIVTCKNDDLKIERLHD